MTIKGKIVTLSSLQIFTLVVVVGLGLWNFSHTTKNIQVATNETFLPVITKDVPQLNRYNESIGFLLNADRDAYQAQLAETLTIGELNEKNLSQFDKDSEENVQQVWDRVEKASAEFDDSMHQLYENFKTKFATWKTRTQTVVSTSTSLAQNASVRQKLHAQSTKTFQEMRGKIDDIQQLLETRIAEGADPEQVEKDRESYELLLNADRDGYQAYLAQCNAFLVRTAEALASEDKDNDENLNQVAERAAKAKVVFDDKMNAIYTEFQAEYDAWKRDSRKIFETAKTDIVTVASRASDIKASDEAFGVMRDSIDALVGRFEERIAQSQTSLAEKGNNAVAQAETLLAQTARFSNIFKAIGIIAPLLAVVATFLFVRGIVRSISRIIVALANASAQTGDAANQSSSTSQALAQGAADAAANIEETSASLQQMTSMLKQSVESAQSANDLVQTANSAAGKGVEAMSRMSNGIDQIRNSADETAKIVKTIDEIAFQTNLLALNAAVEAARAGEAGKGFAVVAEEVRSLAMRAAEAAGNTSQLIDQSVQNAQNGVAISQEVDAAFQEIQSGVTKTAELVSNVASTSNEHANGIEMVNKAVAQLDKVTQDNAANAEESAAAAEELSAQAEELRNAVKNLEALVGAHYTADQPTSRASGKTFTPPRPSPSGRTSTAKKSVSTAVGHDSQYATDGSENIDDF